MSGQVGFAWRTLRSPLTPALVFATGYAVLTVVSVEHLLGEVSPAALQLPLKLSTYVTAATLLGLAFGMTITFGLLCGLTLRWLAGPVEARAIARALGTGLWAFACYILVLAAWISVQPPVPLTRDEILSPAFEADGGAMGDLAWLSELQLAAVGAFFLTAFLSLSRVADRVNALIALVFATAAVVALGTALRALAALLPGSVRY